MDAYRGKNCVWVLVHTPPSLQFALGSGFPVAMTPLMSVSEAVLGGADGQCGLLQAGHAIGLFTLPS